MRRSEAEEQIKWWSIGDRKIFKYVRFLVPNEYVTFKADANKMVRHEPQYSTYVLSDTNTEDLTKMLMSGELVYVKDLGYESYAAIVSMKTGGCQCGSWVISDNEYLHSEKCPKYKNPRSGS